MSIRKWKLLCNIFSTFYKTVNIWKKLLDTIITNLVGNNHKKGNLALSLRDVIVALRIELCDKSCCLQLVDV